MEKTKTENIWLNLGFNIIVPSVLLIKGKKIFEMCNIPLSGTDADMWIFIIALAFPIIYGIFDLVSRRKFNFISVLGIVSVALTGGIGLLKLSRELMIVKEGAVPLMIGVAVLITAFTKKPLAKVLLMNEAVMNLEKINAALDEHHAQEKFNTALKSATILVAFSFLLSSILNVILACIIFKSETGTEAFNEEVGRMTALSFPVIVLPSMIIMIWAMFKILKAIRECTGLTIEDIVAEKPKK